MNSYERVMAAAHHGQPDCLPVAPYMGNFGAAICATPIDSYCRSGRLMAEAQYRAWEMVGQDAVVAQSDNYYIAEGFGLTVEHHQDATPTIRSSPLRGLEDIYRLEVPDPLKDGRMPVYLEAIERLASKLKGEVAIRAPGTGPFALAAHLMGTEEFVTRLALLQGDPDPEVERALATLLDKTTEALVRFEKACLQAGADIVQAGDSTASLDLISPEIYRNWAFPYEKRFFDELNSHAQQRGALTLLHICGDMTSVLEFEAETGAMLIEIDSKVDLSTAQRLIGDRVCLIGNIEPSSVLLQGDPKLVEVKCAEAIQKVDGRRGFILGSGCEVPPRAPLENLRAMVVAARRVRYSQT